MEAAKERRTSNIRDAVAEMDDELMDTNLLVFNEKLQALDGELKEIANHSHNEYLDAVAELKEEKTERLQSADIEFKYQAEYSSRIFDEERVVATEECQAEIAALRQKILEEFDERRRRYREERDSSDLNGASSSLFIAWIC